MAVPTISCPHLYTLDPTITLQVLQQKCQYGTCEGCPPYSGQDQESLWLCLHKGCLAVLCGDNGLNHFAEHNQHHPAHMLLLNLDSFRVWCCICNMEVTCAMRKHMHLNIPGEKVVGYEGEDTAGEDEDMDVGESASTSSPVPHHLGQGEEEVEDEEEEELEEDYEDDHFRDSLYAEEKPRGMTGLVNLGLTCYMNAALQVLNCSPGLASFFLQCEGALTGGSRPPALAPTYRDHLKEVWRRGAPSALSPNGIFHVFRQLHPLFRMFTQQDSQEFLRYFLDELHDDLKQPLPPQPPDTNTEEEEECSSSSESDAEELCSAVGSRSSLFEAGTRPGEGRAREPSWGAQQLGTSPQQDGEGGADSEEARYETCDSGVSADESDFSNSPLLGGTGTKKRRKKRHLNRNDADDNTRAKSQSPRFSSRSPHRPHSQSPHRSVASSASPRSPGSSPSSRSGPSSPKNSARTAASSSSGLGSSKQPSLSSADTFSSAAGSPNNTATRKKKRRGKVHYRSKKSPQQQFSSSVVSDLFDGQLISSVQCLTCNSVSARRETFQDLSLPIPSSDHQSSLPAGQLPQQQQQQISSSSDGWVWWLWQWVVSWVWGPAVSLHHCLNAFFSADELKGDNMYSCEKCGKLRNGLKYSKVVKLPEVLMVHLKRFRHDYIYSSKISQHVAFPLTGLNLQPFLHRDCVSEVRQYALYGVICHHGSVGSGHYTSMAQHPTTGDWYEFDDDCVTRVSAETVQRCQAYVLFYKKVNPEANKVRSICSNIIQVSSRQPSLMRFYISKQWYNKLLSFAECGPIDNSDFLCPHGGVQPRKVHLVGSLVKTVREGVWEYLKGQYGGGPACTRLYICYSCTAALQALLHRQQTELNTFKLLNRQPVRVYGVPISWFRLWEQFVLDRSQLPPPAIDNTDIIKQHQQRKHSSQVFRSAPDHITITGDCWRFFQSTYGGGPEFSLQQAFENGNSQQESVQHQHHHVDHEQQYHYEQQQQQNQHHTQENVSFAEQEPPPSEHGSVTRHGDRPGHSDSQQSVEVGEQGQQPAGSVRANIRPQPLVEDQEMDEEDEEFSARAGEEQALPQPTTLASPEQASLVSREESPEADAENSSAHYFDNTNTAAASPSEARNLAAEAFQSELSSETALHQQKSVPEKTDSSHHQQSAVNRALGVTSGYVTRAATKLSLGNDNTSTRLANELLVCESMETEEEDDEGLIVPYQGRTDASTGADELEAAAQKPAAVATCSVAVTTEAVITGCTGSTAKKLSKRKQKQLSKKKLKNSNGLHEHPKVHA